MADAVKVEHGEGSPENVAYKLWLALHSLGDDERKRHLDVFAECLDAARGYRDYRK